MQMTVQTNESKLNGQTLNSYDPIIWRKDVNIVAKKFPHHIVLDSGNEEIIEKNVEFWTNVYFRTRP
jgi:hypothetical protein